MTTDTESPETAMPEPMTDERLAEIREREQAASPRPWTPSLKYPHVCWVGDDPGEQIISASLSERPAADIAFVAHARQDVPDLLAEVDRLRAELAAAERERDQAVAHDRQPYPTAAAYEKACAALWGHRDRADAAEAEQDRLAKQVKRLREWLEGDVVTARNEFGKGYREAMRDLADLLDGTDAS